MTDAVNVYVVPGSKAARLGRFTEKEIEEGTSAPVIEYTFPAPPAKKGKKKKAEVEDDNDDDNDLERDVAAVTSVQKKRTVKDKGKQAKKTLDQEKDIALGSDEEEGDEQEIPDYMGDDDVLDKGPPTDGILPSSDLSDAEWAVTQPAPKRRAATKTKTSAKCEEVVEVSD